MHETCLVQWYEQSDQKTQRLNRKTKPVTGQQKVGNLKTQGW